MSSNPIYKYLFIYVFIFKMHAYITTLRIHITTYQKLKEFLIINLYKQQIWIFSTQTPKRLLCPVTRTHIATFCNTEQKMKHFPYFASVSSLDSGSSIALGKMSKNRTTSFPTFHGCSTPLFPRLPGIQAPSHLSYPLPKVSIFEFLSQTGISCYGQYPYIHSFLQQAGAYWTLLHRHILWELEESNNEPVSGLPRPEGELMHTHKLTQ